MAAKHECGPDCDWVSALTDSEAEHHRAAGDRVEGTEGHYRLVVEGYRHLPQFSIND